MSVQPVTLLEKKRLALLKLWWGFPLMLAVQTVAAGEESRRVGSPEVLPAQALLRRAQPAYRNYALQNYTQYPDHYFPYTGNVPRAFYGALGDYLITGYDLYRWSERRRPGQEYGSSILKDKAWGFSHQEGLFDRLAVARDSYRGGGYSVVVGDGLLARFTSLTLSKVDFNGVRLDLSTPYLKFTGLGSRIGRPGYGGTGDAAIDNADDVTLLLGSRLQANLGALEVGLNGVNLHAYRSTQPGNSLKGVLPSELPPIDWIVVRFADDSPADGEGGALVQEVHLIVNGEARPDLRPRVVRHRVGVPSQVGSISRSTGEFRAALYNQLVGPGVALYYRGRDEVPLYADYLYRLDHEAGVDVSKNTNLEGLLAHFLVESSDAPLRADGDEQLVFLFDLSQEPYVESVEVEGVLGNDYRVDMATLTEIDPTPRNRQTQFRSTFYRTVLRAAGQVQDLSNLKRVRFKIGENTALFTYSVDAHLALPGLEVEGEYARSAVYARYPAHEQGDLLSGRGPRFAQRGTAYFIVASHRFERGRIGAEHFSMHPDFQTEIPIFQARRNIFDPDTILWRMQNETVYWDLVQDNEDGDHYPDVKLGSLLGDPFDGWAGGDRDVSGVFPGQDEDRDGIPDINRNLNDIPDYEEPFLLYDVEPNDYVYGLDRNHNDEPDRREDDLEPDYPYDRDQRGYHLFGRWQLSPHGSLSAGRFAIAEIAGGGRNRSTYALLTYRREGRARLRRLFFEQHFRRVQDDIADEFTTIVEQPREMSEINEWTRNVARLRGRKQFLNQLRADFLLYQNSYVNDTYLVGRLRPWSVLNLEQQVRLRLNWQRGGRLPSGGAQQARRLDYWTTVSRADYTWRWGQLQLQPQFKFMLLRIMDRRADQALRSEYRVVPIFRLTYPLMSRTTLQVGMQGLGPLPYRVEDQTQRRNSFEQHVAMLTLTNRSRYFGYDLYTIVGLQWEKKVFEDASQQFRGLNGGSFFVRTLIGFTEYGRLL